MLNLV
ncbi:hypothetical protein F383_08926 [Gossypium arboreum]